LAIETCTSQSVETEEADQRLLGICICFPSMRLVTSESSNRRSAMPTSAEEYYAHNAEAMKPVRETMSDLVKGFGGLHQAAMKPGSLDTRQKELIALGIGLAVRCESCIYAHVRAAIKAGATREQILEAAGVAVMMAGGPTYTYLPRVTEALDALAARGEVT
jgi:AhpD family alkylhydroperoxidase